MTHQASRRAAPCAALAAVLALALGGSVAASPRRSAVVPRPSDSTGITVIQLPGVGEAVAVGAGGVWVTVIGHPTGVYRVDPFTNQVVTTIPVDLPTGIAAGSDAVWVTDERHDAVLRIYPRANKIIARIVVGSGPRRIVVAEGRVWVMNLLGHSISSIDPATNRVVGEEIPVGRARAMALVAGVLWVGHGPPPGRVQPYDPHTGQSAGDSLETDGVPVAILGGGGSIWVADLYGDVYRFDSASHRLVSRVSVDSTAFDAVASRDAIFVAAARGTRDSVSSIRPIDLRSGQLAIDNLSPLRRLAFTELNGLAMGEGSLWVASKGALTRIDQATLMKR